MTLTCLVTFALTFVFAFVLGALAHAVVLKQLRQRSKGVARSENGASQNGQAHEIIS